MNRQRTHPYSLDGVFAPSLREGGDNGGPRIERSLLSRTTNENNYPKRTPASSSAKFYPMNGEKRGKVVIFNQIFKGEKTERKGTEKDVKRLKNTLPKLGFQPEDIIHYDDLTQFEIFQKASELQNDRGLQNFDCLVVVILTHGEKDDLLHAKDDLFHLYSFLDIFSSSNLPSMVGKPKIFIIQACRGDREDKGVNVRYVANDVKDPVDSHSNNITRPQFADLLIGMSSHYGHYSRRDPETGSWFIQELCNVIDQCDLNASSIFDILTKTNNAVAKRSSSKETKQIPSFHSTLTKQVYFRSVPNQVQRNKFTQPAESTVGDVTEDRENEITRELEQQRIRKQESDILREKERERERTRKRESDWFKEEQQHQERSRKQESEWMKEKEQDRERSRKQEIDWVKEKEQDRERIRQQESVWKQERQEERNKVRQQERVWTKEKNLERAMERNREKQWEVERMRVGKAADVRESESESNSDNEIEGSTG